MTAVLTIRERQVIAAVARGLSNKEVATELGLAEGTVKVYIRHVKAKDPSCANRHQLVTHLLRDEERARAALLAEWIVKWGDQLSDAAGVEIRLILAAQISRILC